MTPTVTRTRVVTRVAAASFWKRVSELLTALGGRGRRSRWMRRNSSAVADGPPVPVIRTSIAAALAALPCFWSPAAAVNPAPPPRIGGSVRKRRGALRRAPDPTSLPDAWDTASQSPRDPLHRHEPDRLRPGADRLPLPRRGHSASSARRTARRRWPSTTSPTDPETPVTTAEGEFVWAIPDERGMYVVNADLPHAGSGARRSPPRRRVPTEKIRMTFEVRDSTPTVMVGDPAPASETPTAADVDGDLAQISTDEEPVPAFYETSVADALAANKPFVLVFATPKFCTSQQCGPTLDHDQADRRGASRRDVHQRRAVCPRVHRGPAAAGARRERAAPAAPT